MAVERELDGEDVSRLAAVDLLALVVEADITYAVFVPFALGIGRADP
jgi:hypothetical protein